MNVGDRARWNDPDGGICSQRVTIVSIKNEMVIVRPYPCHGGGDQFNFEVLMEELTPWPKANEIWTTKSGRVVLIVEHPMTEVEDNVGFVWWDSVDNNMNFSPVLDQLAERADHHDLVTWGALMAFNLGQLKVENRPSQPAMPDYEPDLPPVDGPWYVKDDEGKMHGPYTDEEEAKADADRIDGIVVEDL